MEDNEFEEVTIISHTDHGTSVLPQSTAERLMKEIKLEVTQKISQNENVKLGSLQHSTTPTLLDRLQSMLSKVSISGQTFFISSTAEKSFVITDTGAVIMYKQGNYKQLSMQGGFPFFVQTWGPYLMMCEFYAPVSALDQDGELVKKFSQPANGSFGWSAIPNKRFFYFMNTENRLC